MRVLADFQLNCYTNVMPLTAEGQKEWRAKNPEKVREYNKRWKEKNRARVAEASRLRDQDPKRKLAKLEATRKWRERNKEKHRMQSREWAKKNPEYVYFHNKQRAKRLKEKGTFTYSEWQEMKLRYGFICPCCKLSEPNVRLEMDHIKPISKGGLNIADNIQPLCGPCNRKKYTREVRYESPC